jgi:hypothetical protein
MTGMVFSGAAALPDALRDPEWGPSSEPSKSAFIYSVKDEKLADFFEYLKVHVSFTHHCALEFGITCFIARQRQSTWSGKVRRAKLLTAFPFSYFRRE